MAIDTVADQGLVVVVGELMSDFVGCVLDERG